MLHPEKEKILDPGIARIKIDETKREFRTNASRFQVGDKLVLRDYAALANEIAEKVYASPLDAEGDEIERPVKIDDAMRECCPQFSLRNIPKIQRYYDVDGDTRFNCSDLPTEEAFEAYDTAHNAKLPKVEPIKFVSAEILADFRTFLEEIFYLCPWDKIKDSFHEDDTLWSLEHSRAQLAAELYRKRGEFISYGHNIMRSTDGLKVDNIQFDE